MVRYKATISYDGRLFAGFQRQPSERSVQEELEKTLQKLNSGNPVKVHGAGCTFASSIASQLVLGKSAKAAVEQSKEFVYQAIRHSDQYGVKQNYEEN